MIRYHARWVLPIRSAALRDATVAVEGGRIAFVGSRGDAPAGEDVELGEAILMPGLVNAHTHLELTTMRGFIEGLDFLDWILRLTTAKRAVLTRDDLLDAARYGIAEGLRAGVTSYGDTCDSGVALDAMLEYGVRGVMYQEVFGPDPAQCDRSMAALRGKLAQQLPRQTDRVRVGISPHAPYTVSDALYEACAALAAESGLPIAVHIAEGVHESRLVEEGDGVFADGLRRRGIAVAPRAESPMALLAKTGILDAGPLLIHCVRLSEADVGRIASTPAGVVHCPASNARLGHGIAPLRELLDAGIPVGLGSDSMASNNRMDILEEARLAAMFQGARLQRADAVPPREAVELATLGGARVLGIADRVGTLEAGKDADLTAFALDLPHAQPVQEPEAAALHALRGTDAILTMVQGEVLCRDGRLRVGDPALPERVRAAGERLGAWLTEALARGPITPPVSDTR